MEYIELHIQLTSKMFSFDIELFNIFEIIISQFIHILNHHIVHVLSFYMLCQYSNKARKNKNKLIQTVFILYTIRLLQFISILLNFKWPFQRIIVSYLTTKYNIFMFLIQPAYLNFKLSILTQNPTQIILSDKNSISFSKFLYLLLLVKCYKAKKNQELKKKSSIRKIS